MAVGSRSRCLRPAVLPSTPPPAPAWPQSCAGLHDPGREARGQSRGAPWRAKAMSPAASRADGRQMLRTCLPRRPRPHTRGCSDMRTHTLVHTHPCTHPHVHAQPHRHSLLLTYIHTHTSMYSLKPVHTHTHPHTQTYSCPRKHTLVHTGRHIHECTYTLTLTHTHTAGFSWGP